MIVHCITFPHAVMAHYGQLIGYLEKGFSVFRNIPMNFFLQHIHPTSRNLSQKQILSFRTFTQARYLEFVLTERAKALSSCTWCFKKKLQKQKSVITSMHL